MKKLNVNFKIVFVGIIILALSCDLMAQPLQERARQREQKARFTEMVPGLTEEQRNQLKEIHLATLKEVQPLKDELKVNNARLNILLKQDNPDMKEINNLVEANADIQARVMMLSIEGRVKTRSLLTEEQKILFDAGGLRLQKQDLTMESYRQRDLQPRNRLYSQRNRSYHQRSRF
jgi:hypothetical protein